jgi:hypothetical protein
MALLRLTYSGNVYNAAPAGTVDFPLVTKGGKNIPYLQRSHIHVYRSVDQGVTWTELARPTQWDFDSTGTIARLKSAVTGEWILVRRITPYQELYTQFQDSSLLTADQLNEAEKFGLYVNQEQFDSGDQGFWSDPHQVVTKPMQRAGTWPADGKDEHIATTDAIAARHDNYLQPGLPTPVVAPEKEQPGKLWLDNDDILSRFWDPTANAWVTLANTGPKGDKGDKGDRGEPGGVAFKGDIDVTAAPPSGAQAGWQYVTTTTGTAHPGFVGITGTVTKGNLLLYTGDTWIIQQDAIPGVVDATESSRGIVELASPDETKNGTDATRAVHPAGLKSALAEYPKQGVRGTAANPGYYFDDGTGLYSPSENQVAISTNGTERLRIDPTGQIEAVSLGSAAAPTFSWTGDPNTGIYSPGADQVAISTNGTGRLFVDSFGRLLAGTSSALNVGGNAGFEQFQLAGLGASLTRFDNGASSPVLTFAKSRGTATGANTVVSSGDAIGQIYFNGADGTGYVPAALIEARVDGIPGTNDMPGRLVFSTTADGSASPTERMRLDSSGRLLVGTSSVINVGTLNQAIQIAGTGGPGNLTVSRYTNDVTGSLIGIGKSRSTTVGGFGIVSAGDNLGQYSFYGADGAAFIEAARVSAQVDGTAGANDMPGRLVFSTTADGASSPTERMRLDSSGRLGLGTSSPGSYNASGDDLVIANTGANAGITVATGSSFASRIYFADGTTGSETLAGFLDYNHSTDSLSFGVNASERARIDSSGRLLVGTSSALNVSGSAGFEGFQVAGTGSGSNVSLSRWAATTGAAVFSFAKSRGASIGTNTVVVADDSIGRLDFNAADGTSFISAAQIQAFVDGTPGTNDMPGRLVFSTTADGATNPTERMRITQDGDVFINHNSSTSPVVGGEKLGVVGGSNMAIAASTATNTVPTVYLANTSDTANTHLMRFSTGAGGNTRGEIYYNGSQLIYATSSDYRLKENVQPLLSGIELVNRLRPVTYQWIENQNHDIGFIAHEVQEVFPNAVGGDKDAVDENGKILPQTYDPSKLVPLLTAALQEALTEIDKLKARVAALEPAAPQKQADPGSK